VEYVRYKIREEKSRLEQRMRDQTRAGQAKETKRAAERVRTKEGVHLRHPFFGFPLMQTTPVLIKCPEPGPEPAPNIPQKMRITAKSQLQIYPYS
jgi:hypothetical protein